MGECAIKTGKTSLVRFIVEPDEVCITCYKLPLAEMSFVFSIMFRKTLIDTVKVKYASPQAVHWFIQFLCSTRVEMIKLPSMSMAWEMYRLFVRYQVIKVLFDTFKTYMISELPKFPREVLISLQNAFNYHDEHLITGIEMYIYENSDCLNTAYVEGVSMELLLRIVQYKHIRVNELTFLILLENYHEYRKMRKLPYYKMTMKILLSHIRFLTLTGKELTRMRKSPLLTKSEKRAIKINARNPEGNNEYPKYFSQKRHKRHLA